MGSCESFHNNPATPMTLHLDDLAERIGARILTRADSPPLIDRVFAGDRISDLLNQSHDKALLVSNLVGPQLVRVAELMDVPAICLVNGALPEPAVIQAAREHGTALLVSPVDMFQTCGRLYLCLREGAATAT